MSEVNIFTSTELIQNYVNAPPEIHVLASRPDLESFRTELMMRIACNIAKKASQKALYIMMCRRESDSVEILPEIQVFPSPRTANEIRAILEKDDFSCVVIDYLQLTKSNHPGESRAEECSKIVCDLKQIAEDFQLPVLVLYHLNQDIQLTENGNNRPILSMLREFKTLEPEAGTVSFLHRSSLGMELILEKNRYGETGICKLPAVTALQTSEITL